MSNVGIVSPFKLYHCTKCKKQVLEYEIDHTICPCCMRPLKTHKGCGGVVVENRLPILY